MNDVVFNVMGHVGLITLNRPKALNALTRDMCIAMHAKLNEWKDNGAIHAVVIMGEGEKAFCAGGDVVALYHSGKAYRDGDKSSTDWMSFFHDEYRLNVAIAEFPKPYIAIMDGIVMGGGVGVSVHGSYRIATERTMLAMPETGLGLFPDVGGGWFMPRLRGEMGMYLALSGDRVKAPDCMDLGISNAFIASTDMPTFLDRLCMDKALTHDRVKALLADHSSKAEAPRLTEYEDMINRCFAKDSVEGILSALAAEEGEWAQKTHAGLMKKSPTSMKATFHQMREGRNMPDIRANMVMEYRLARHILQGHDFYEGVRAILLEKDMNPQWMPDSLDGVSDADVDKCFAPFDGQDLSFEQGDN